MVIIDKDANPGCLENVEQIHAIKRLRLTSKAFQEYNRNCPWCAEMIKVAHYNMFIEFQPEYWRERVREAWHTDCFWEFVAITCGGNNEKES